MAIFTGEATVTAGVGDLDDDVKRLLSAILEFSAVMRRDEAPDKEDSGLGLAGTMRRYGLGQRHISALLTVALWGPITVSDVAGRHHVQVKTASLVAVELEQAGLLARRTDPADRRRTILAVPAAKEQVVKAGLRKRAARLRKVLDGLTATQREGLILGLEELAHQQSAATSTTSRAVASSVSPQAEGAHQDAYFE